MRSATGGHRAVAAGREPRADWRREGPHNDESAHGAAIRGVLSKGGRLDLGVSTDLNGQYLVSVQPDVSSVVTIIDRGDSGCETGRTLRLSPQGDVLGDRVKNYQCPH